MKKLLLIITLLVCVIKISSQEANYNILGNVSLGVSKVYLYALGERTPIDSAVVDKGEFSLSGKTPLYTVLTINLGDYMLPIINDGQPINVDIEKDVFSGSKINEKLYEYDRELNRKYSEPISKIYEELDSLAEDNSQESIEKQKALEDKYEQLSDEMTDDIVSIVRENKDNYIPMVFISQAVYALDYNELQELLSPDKPYHDHPAMVIVKNQASALEKRLPGKMFMDLTLSDSDGSSKELSSWIAKEDYVLLDFWASWCGPCRKEMPNIKENYQKYHKSGLEIIGISLDSNPDAWKSAIKALGLDWPQLSDLKGWKSEAALTYGIRAIPANVLLDKDGKIIAVDLLGRRLSSKLTEIFGF